MQKEADFLEKTGSYKIIEYRKTIITDICKSGELVKLLGCTGEEDPKDQILYKQCFPYNYIPDTVTGTERFISFDIGSIRNEKNHMYSDLTVYFYIICHQDAARYHENSEEILWHDKAACELYRIFGGKNTLGLGKASLLSNEPYSPLKNLTGRILKFAVRDFNNGS